MRKLPLMIIGVSLLFLGLGGIAKQVRKYFTNDEQRYEFVTVRESVTIPPPAPEISGDSPHQVIIVGKPQQQLSDIKIKIDPPLPPEALKEAGTNEFNIEGNVDQKSFVITRDSDETLEKKDFNIYQNEADETGKANRKKMRIIIRKDKQPE